MNLYMSDPNSLFLKCCTLYPYFVFHALMSLHVKSCPYIDGSYIEATLGSTFICDELIYAGISVLTPAAALFVTMTYLAEHTSFKSLGLRCCIGTDKASKVVQSTMSILIRLLPQYSGQKRKTISGRSKTRITTCTA